MKRNCDMRIHEYHCSDDAKYNIIQDGRIIASYCENHYNWMFKGKKPISFDVEEITDYRAIIGGKEDD